MQRLALSIVVSCALRVSSGCNPCRDTPKPAVEGEREARPLVMQVVEQPRSTPFTTIQALPNGEPSLVAFIVWLDARADHTSLCGYPRPTTPTLNRFAALGAASCSGIAASPDPNTSLQATLHGQAESLAQTFQARGYHTLLVSTGPTGDAPRGTFDGFDRVASPVERVADARYDLGATVQEQLSALPHDEPVLITVLLADASPPWPAIPPGLRWLPARRPLALDLAATDGEMAVLRSTTLDDPARTKLRSRMIDAYDFGLARLDRHTSQLLDALAAVTNYPTRRVAIAGLTGFGLGEHGAFGHPAELWDTLLRVPVVLWAGDAHIAPLPRIPWSADSVRDWLVTGSLPEPESILTRSSATMTAAWGTNQHKALAWQGKRYAIDLANDPGESTLTRLPSDDPLQTALETGNAGQK